MKHLVLSSLVVMLCVSVSQAAVGDTHLYNFDNLADGNLDGAADAIVDWVAIANPGYFYISSGTAYEQHSKQEQLVGTLVGGAGGTKPINLQAGDTNLLVSATVEMNPHSGSYIGLWVDGNNADPNDANTMPTNNSELLCQFGIGTYKTSWRVRGAAGANSQYSATVPADGSMPLMTLNLVIQMTANAGDGKMDFFVYQGGALYTSIRGIPMGLLTADPNFSDPTKITSWWIRSQADGGALDPNVCPIPQSIDDLYVAVIPEPATMSLLVLGGLAALRRRR